MGVVGAIRSDSGLGLVGRSGRHWCAGIVGCCWVPAGDAGMTGARRAWGGGWARLGMCSVGRADVFSFGGDVFSFSANVFSFGPNVSSFRPNVFSFEGNVSTLAGDVSSFGWGALVGDGAGTEGEIPRLRCAALEMTTAAGEVRWGCVRGRGVVRQAHQGRWVRWD